MLAAGWESIVVCPVCQSALIMDGAILRCTKGECGSSYPIVNGVPILIHEELSTFVISEYRQQKSPPATSVRVLAPRIGLNLAAKGNFRKFRELLLQQASRPRVLVVGGAEIGYGLESLLNDPKFEFFETDVRFGPRTKLICDGAALPFVAETFDGVVVQAVLEYVVDPYQCAREIHRVLKDNGIVYSEMPFMQAVHGGRYDFLRMTHLGHRRLYRQFREISSGPVSGPGTALAWAIRQFFLSFARSPTVRKAIKAAVALTCFWVKYVDYALANTPGGMDGCGGTYVMARKSNEVLSDRELITQYRGAIRRSEAL